jgi:hypothetical protein
MTMRACLATIILACCLPSLALAQSQTVWRCGPDGRVFSDAPCADGRLVATVDPRPAADVQAAREMAQREQRLADKLRDERVQREAVGPGAGLAGIGPLKEKLKPQAKKTPNKRHRVQKHSADEETWPAVVPASRQRRG